MTSVPSPTRIIMEMGLNMNIPEIKKLEMVPVPESRPKLL
jgi:hypothetical protein